MSTSSFRAAIAAVVLAVVGVVAVVVTLTTSPSRALHGVSADTSVVPASQGIAAPELTGITAFDNTAPLTLKGLQGRVVLVDFWTYTCINCRRTFPFLKALHDQYPGLTVLGVHSPEFGFEKAHDNVARAVKELGITWPVAEDPDMKTWAAFENQYWPAEYLIDKHGLVRYSHFGEGNDAATEKAVRALLAEDGGTVPPAIGQLPAEQGHVQITPESYLGAERGSGYVVGSVVPAGRTVTRHDRTSAPDLIAIDGPVIGGQDSLELLRGASLTQRFTAKDVYATTSPAGGEVVLDVTLDGKPVPADRRGDSLVVRGGRTVAVIAHQDLLHLVTGTSVSGGVLKVTAVDDGAQFFTFTYGS